VDTMAKDTKHTQELDHTAEANAVDLQHQREMARTKRLAKDGRK